MRCRLRLLSLALILGLAWAGLSQSAMGDDLTDRLRETLKDKHAEGTDLWIYNNLKFAREEARRENKPIFVTFRCVPCQSCSAFDATVAKDSEIIDRLARQSFVSVRQVEMKGVDLSQFEFDHDLNWAAMFINADGTVYARYGTQSAKGPDAYNSIAGLETTMRRVLELHRNYPKNKAELQGKRGPQKPYRTALDMPGLHNKEQRGGPTTRQNCIHCHNIHDALNQQAQDSGQFTEDLLWRYPLPDNVGLIINAKDGRRVDQVKPDSPAAAAGIGTGEVVTHMNGQAVTSIADMQWVLHHLPNADAELKVATAKTGEHVLKLKKGWKVSDISWRGSMWSVAPKLRVFAPNVSEEERRKHGIPANQTALLVKWINTGSPGGKSARDGGLREGDVIVELDGKPLGDWTNKQFNAHIKLHYKVGQTLPLTVLREKRKETVRIKLVE